MRPAAGSRSASRSRRRTAAGSTRCRPGRCRCDTSLYSGDFDGSPSKTSRKRPRKRVRPASSSGNSRAGSRRTSRHRVDGALGVDVEGADRFDLVVEQVDAVGQRAAHREQVDQAAAYAEFAGRNDLRDVLIAGERELRAQAIDVERFALLEEKRERREIRRRREAVQRRRRRDDHHVAIAARHAVERRQPLRHQILMRREMVVGQRLPVGQDGDLERRREP